LKIEKGERGQRSLLYFFFNFQSSIFNLCRQSRRPRDAVTAPRAPNPYVDNMGAPALAPVAAPIFVARGLTKIYRMGDVDVPALRGIDLDLFEGEFIVLLGPSGSGKSTLLNILGGLDAPTSGAVHFRDHELTGADERELTRFRREHVGFVFQFYNLIPSLTALENVEIVTEIADKPMNARDALALVQLSDRADHFPAQLSGGEQQRVAIARAVAKNPDVLLCDEPTGALDYATGKLVLNVLQDVNREMHTTVAVITHNAAIAGMADRIVRMGSGSIVEMKRNDRKISPEELQW
jgi:putative ABC transport system ATP-binding protein